MGWNKPWSVPSFLGIERDEIAASLRALLGLPNFKPNRIEEIAAAIGYYESGLDFGDALHLARKIGDRPRFYARLWPERKNRGQTTVLC
jgi:hypothetical protein